jgi:hypothetical protein
MRVFKNRMLKKSLGLREKRRGKMAVFWGGAPCSLGDRSDDGGSKNL